MPRQIQGKRTGIAAQVRALPPEMRWLVTAIVVLTPHLAHAGYCLDDSERTDYLKALTKVAGGNRDKATLGTAGNLWCIIHGPSGDHDATPAEVVKRTTAVSSACTKVIAGHDKQKAGDPEIEESLGYLVDECTTHLVANAVTTIGSHDLFADLASKKYNWHDAPPYAVIATSGDARARLFVLDQFRAAIAAVGTKKLVGWQAKAWQDHRIGALDAIAKVGTADDVAFVDEVVAATPAKDKKVLAAAKQARDAAQARPAGSPPAK